QRRSAGGGVPGARDRTDRPGRRPRPDGVPPHPDQGTALGTRRTSSSVFLFKWLAPFETDIRIGVSMENPKPDRLLGFEIVIGELSGRGVLADGQAFDSALDA